VALNPTAAIRRGVRRVANRTGLALIVGYALLGTASQVLLNGVFGAVLRRAGVASAGPAGPLAVDAPLPVLAAAASVLLVVATAFGVVSIRAVAADSGASRASLLRNLGPVLVHALLGGVALAVVVLLGSVLLVLPGVVAYVTFLFVPLVVALDDASVLAAFRESRALTAGHRLSLFGLLVAVTLAASLVLVAAALLLAPPLSDAVGRSASALATNLLLVPLSVATLGIQVEAFAQLRGGTATR
jgi:hypothetical protein